MSDYEGFSKQDLIDRLEALGIESNDLYIRNREIIDEIRLIGKLLEEKK